MQYPFSCTPATFAGVKAALSPARLVRYMPAAQGDEHFALRLYVWNARLCEALYLPLQFAEISSRNAIQIPVGKRFQDDWFRNAKFINILSAKMKSELSEVTRKEEKKRGIALTQNHIIAALSFGFWVRLMTRAYDKHLWLNGVRGSFPNANRADDRDTIHSRLDSLRKFRNDVAHHYAIFDKGPHKEFQNALYVTNLVCEETHWLSSELSKVGRVLEEKPRS